MTSRADAMSVGNGTTVNFHVLNLICYLQEDLFVRIRRIKDQEILLRGASLLPRDLTARLALPVRSRILPHHTISDLPRYGQR